MLAHTPLPPRAPLVLGAAGLLPCLVALSAVMFASRGMQDLAFRAAGIYAAAILSFLGGAWWGIASARGHPRALFRWLSISAAPPLLGVTAAVFLSPISLGAMGVGFLACLWMDLKLRADFLAPEWWVALRVPLSLCMAGLCLAIAVVRAAKT